MKNQPCPNRDRFVIGVRTTARLRPEEEYERFSNAEAGKPTGVKSNEALNGTYGESGTLQLSKPLRKATNGYTWIDIQ